MNRDAEATPSESADDITDHDRDVGNLMIRAGYVRGLAERFTGDERLFLLRASRSLRAYAELVVEKRLLRCPECGDAWIDCPHNPPWRTEKGV